MKYIKAELGNGYCGFDEEFLMEFPDEATEGLINEEVFCNYSYTDGGGGLDPYDEEQYDEYEDYLDEIYYNSIWEEITEEEFIKLRDEEGWEVR